MKNPEAFSAVAVASSIASSATGYALHDASNGGAFFAAFVLAIIFGVLGYLAAERK